MTLVQRRNTDVDKKNNCVKWCNANNHSDFAIATKGGDIQMYFNADCVVTATLFSLMILDAASAREAETSSSPQNPRDTSKLYLNEITQIISLYVHFVSPCSH